MNRHLSRVVVLVRRWLGADTRKRSLDEELESFIQHDVDARIASGMREDEARRTALASIGGMRQFTEHVQGATMGASLEALVRDVSYASRAARRSGGLSLAIVGSLATGLAVTVVAFAFINAWLFKEFPGISQQDRLVHLELRRMPDGRPPGIPLDSADDYRVVRAGLSRLGEVAATTQQRMALELPEPHSVLGVFVSENYFDVLGVRIRGRTFRSNEGEPNAPVAVISDRLWRAVLARDASVIGKHIRVGGQIVEVIGVTPEGFAGTRIQLGGERPDIWLPLALADRVAPNARPVLRADNLSLVARLQSGVSADAFAAAAQSIAAQQAHAVAAQSGLAAVIQIGMDTARRPLRVAIVLGIPVLVLVIACVNAASLTLARGSRQRRDVAIRLAIGASRDRVVRQLLIESLALAFAAMVIALPLAWLALSTVEARLSLPMPIDLPVVGWTVLTTVICAVVSGLAPAFRITSQAPLRALSVSRGATATTPSETRRKRFNSVAQIALSIGVLATGTQLIALVDGQGGTGGTPPNRLLMASFDFDQLRLPPQTASAFYQRLLEGASRLPGAVSVGLARPTSVWTFGRGKGPGSVIVWAPGREPEIVIGGYAGGDLFGAIGLTLLNGRTFTAEDGTGPPRVAVVNMAYANGFPDRRAIGRTVRVASWRRQSDSEAQAEARDVTIIGVVESAGERRYSRDGSAVGKLYLPSPLGPEPALTLYVRTRQRADDLSPALHELVNRIDARVPIGDIGSLASFNERSMGASHWLARISALLGVIAVALAAAGLLAVTSYNVTQRAREFAVRLALGAEPRGLVALVVTQALKTVAIGFVVGGTLALGVTQLIAAQFHGAERVNVSAFGQSSAFLAAVMLIASAIPAIRAARVDPILNLKDG